MRLFRISKIIVLLSLFCSVTWGGVDFDGIDDVISFTSVNQTIITVSAWIFRETAGDSVAPRCIDFPGYLWFTLSDGGGTNNDNIGFQSLRSGDMGDWRSPNDSILPDNAWHHIAVTYDGTATTNDPKIYIDGVSVTVTQLGGDPSGAQTSNAGTAYIGNNAGGTRSHDGQFTEIAIWSSVLSQTEISLLANSGRKRLTKEIQPANTNSDFPMNDQPDGTSFDGDTAVDRSGNSNDGVGDDGANNTGLTAKAEIVLSYP